MSSDKEKLESLSKRIRQAEAGAKPKPKAEPSPMRNAGFDFAGAVLGAVILGILLDRFFGTTPWCLIGMVVLGFVSGIMGLWRASQRKE
jgi:ATP synthase protein I